LEKTHGTGSKKRSIRRKVKRREENIESEDKKLRKKVSNEEIKCGTGGAVQSCE
jgi:hypothetical protein